MALIPGMLLQTETLETALSENATIILLTIYVLLLAIFLGFELIGRVPATLHTPLMSGTNAIHGIVIVGAMFVAGIADPDLLTGWVGFVAVVLGAANVVGGFVVTDRMLEMFKKREAPPKDPSGVGSTEPPTSGGTGSAGAGAGR